MQEYPKHLYMTIFPNNALISSQLSPVEFAKHFVLGSAKHFKGKVIFAEIDSAFRDRYFAIDEYLAQTVPYENGSPKKTKFIASYAVLEHVPLQVIQRLYLATSSGKTLELSSTPYTAVNEPGLVRIYQEIAPLQNLVASTLDQRNFGKYITQESRSKGAPKMCFTQIELDIPEFIETNKNRHLIISPIPRHHPYRLYECIVELLENPQKRTKTISLGSLLDEIPYFRLRHGIWFADKQDLLFFPMPGHNELKDKYYSWWKDAY